MSEKRRDSKNRVLRTGESQKKDGRYMYKYTDSVGKIRYVYSWKLVSTDTVPHGLKDDIALRDKEKQIQKDLSDGIISNGGNITVYELVKKYLSQKTGVRHGTKSNYDYVLRLIEKEDFCRERIDRIKMSDVKSWLIKLQADGRSYSIIYMVRSVIKPAFQMAVTDDLIRKNPFDFQLTSVVVNDSVKREALTDEQEQQFLDFIANDKHFKKYYEAVYILFSTGLRIGEFSGLTFDDIDLNKGIINVNHQLQRKKDNEYVIDSTKTSSGTRLVPMTDGVRECFKRIIEQRKKPKQEPIVDGLQGFLYLDRHELPMISKHWDKYFKDMVLKYNKTHDVKLPNVTPHVCRHTFITKMARAGMNPKALQTIVGHSNISITLNVYTHLNFDDIQCEMNKITQS
jgi:site-specific recombinase XerD